MKKFYTNFLLFVVVLLTSMQVTAQNFSTREKYPSNIPTLNLASPNVQALLMEDVERSKNGQFHRIAVSNDVMVTPSNAGIWTVQPNGDRVWNLTVKNPGAEALSFIFDNFYLYGGSTFNVYGPIRKSLHKEISVADVLEHGQQHLPLCEGEVMTLELIEPYGAAPSKITLNQVYYVYRDSGFGNKQKDFNSSESCEVNVNCPEGSNYQDEKRGVARILVTVSAGQGWCSGSLVNNLRQDCKPYFLTAMHCAVGATAANFNNFKFYFNFEASGCTSPSSVGTLANNLITGCVKLAGSEDVNGNIISKSDLLLVQLGTTATESTIVSTLKSANFNAYWNGWDATSVTTYSGGGVGIHHPAGDIKKVSTYSANLISTTYSNITANTHWRVNWISTATNHGVTEGGSSGSPLFTYNSGNSRIVGTLSGGSSYCQTPNDPDLYGKMSYHWTSNGTTAAMQLKPWLDPDNTGTLFINGSYDPCATNPNAAPVANFVANATNVNVGATVSFTDQSTNSPTTWTWSISPGTGWSFASGTSATSQHPSVTFTAAGTYSVTIQASNANGSDSEVKTGYIIVTAVPTGNNPCAATSTNPNCDEYISNFKLGSIDNTTGCTNYSYYQNMTATLTKGSTYTATVVPAIGTEVGTAYNNDQIAIWIDYNNDGDFTDAGEQVAHYTFAASNNYNGQLSFTVPSTVTNGTKRMRVRINYLATGSINPCGTSADGEVEDYNVNITGNMGVETEFLNAVNIFPNPATESLTIDLNENVQFAEISVVDLTGKVVLETVVNNVKQTQLNLDLLNSGLYQVVINTEFGKVVKRISKL